MKMKTIKRLLLWSGCTLLLITLGVAFHIWWVYRPRVDANTKVMARIDIGKPIGPDDVKRINSWLYEQNGVDHVLVNPTTRVVVFTFYPLKTSADAIAKRFEMDLPYDSRRFMPTEKDLSSGCPVAPSSFYFKIYKFMDHIL
jgi:hypothetical protein